MTDGPHPSSSPRSGRQRPLRRDQAQRGSVDHAPTHAQQTSHGQNPRHGQQTSHAQQTNHAEAQVHGHGSAPASRQVKQLLAIALVPFALAAITGVLLLYPFGHDQRTGADLGFGQYPVNAEVVSAAAGSCVGDAPASAPDGGCVRLQVSMQDGPTPGRTIEQVLPTDPSTPKFAVGDDVVLAYSGTNPEAETSYQVVDFQRGGSLLVLALVFAAAVLVLGRWQGLAALGALGLSFVVLVGFILPAILAGQDPLLVAIVGAGVIMFTVLYLTHGFSARTSAAVLGTMLSLGLIGALSALFAATTQLTGLDENTASLIGVLGTAIDARGLLLAGIVIGALGVLDDVTVTQTSAVWELRRANPALTWRRLYSAGLRIGRDHVSSSVNTLVLAYAGASLPLLLAYSLSGRTFTEIVSSQAVAQEVVRTLVGSIGLVAAVPITTAIAATVAVREPAGSAAGTHRGVADRVSKAAAASASTATTRRRTQRRNQPG